MVHKADEQRRSAGKRSIQHCVPGQLGPGLTAGRGSVRSLKRSKLLFKLAACAGSGVCPDLGAGPQLPVNVTPVITANLPLS